MGTWAAVKGSSLGAGFLGGWEATLAQEVEAEAGLSRPPEEAFTGPGFTAWSLPPSTAAQSQESSTFNLTQNQFGSTSSMEHSG